MLLPHTKTFIYIVVALSLLVPLGRPLFAYVASSTNYRLERDSLNIGGVLSTSSSYGLEDTVGEIGTGVGTSSSYVLYAGYQQMDSAVTLSISSPSDVTLSPAIPQAGGIANGSALWTVTTNNSLGYTLALSAGQSPAMQGPTATFADYTTGGSPTFAWGVGTGAKEFGFSPEGTEITTAYKDNGSTCGVGSSDTSDACWDAFTTSTKTIASRASSNSPSGTATTVKLRAQATSGSNPAVEDYSATITATALAQ